METIQIGYDVKKYNKEYYERTKEENKTKNKATPLKEMGLYATKKIMKEPINVI